MSDSGRSVNRRNGNPVDASCRPLVAKRHGDRGRSAWYEAQARTRFGRRPCQSRDELQEALGVISMRPPVSHDTRPRTGRRLA
jgi:hypothetical protein